MLRNSLWQWFFVPLAASACACVAACGVPIDGDAALEPQRDPGERDEAELLAPAPARALAEVNAIRASAGLPAAAAIPEIEQAALAHAEYYLVNPLPGLDAHKEEPGFAEFTGATFDVRMAAAGYTGQPFSEVMHFVGDPVLAVQGWRDSIFHRIPIVHPNATQLGYGVAGDAPFAACDVMDFGRGPSGAFPSRPVVTLTFDDGSVPLLDRHEVFDERGNALEHTYLSSSTPDLGAFMTNTVALYTEPLPHGATLRVVIGGLVNFNAFEMEWSFTVCTECP